ncbi:cytochrome P450 [Streptomyces sp. NPDC060028]|uniref:cytochrome P450 n=1 Tax=Streptomyces sp. NPDC060028 TaxID=3347041 RepID=UPI00369CE490
MPFTPASQVPDAPGAVPLLGHTLRLLRDPLDWLLECAHAEPVVRVRLGPRTAYLVCRADLVHDVLVGQVNSFDKGGPFFDRYREVIGNGIGSDIHADHRAQRLLMQPAFTRSHIDTYTPILQEESAALTDSWRPGTEVDLVHGLMTVATKVLSRAILPTLNTREAESILPDLQAVMAGLMTRIAIPYNWPLDLPLPTNRRFTRSLAALRAAAARWVAAARQDPRSGGLLASFIQAGTDDPAHVLDDTDLRDQVITLLIAGTDTTSATLGWLFHLLTLHAEHEERLHHELDTVLGGALAGPDTYDRLPLTRGLLLETMRLYPAGPLLSRVSTTPVTLAGHHFPPGTDFFISAYLLHHHPTAFPDPHGFDPDRWTVSRQPDAHHGYIPFGAGKRKCIGDTLALAEATTLVSAIASRWRLHPAPGTRVRPLLRTTLIPAGLNLIAVPRRP